MLTTSETIPPHCDETEPRNASATGAPAARRLRDDAVERFARDVIARLNANIADCGRRATGSGSAVAPSAGDVRALAEALIGPHPGPAADLVRTSLARGQSVDQVCLGPLASAARLLGDWWEADKVPFTDVALGAARINAILRDLRPEAPLSARQAIFAAVPGETHTIGVTMAADLFRRHGWDVSLAVGYDHGALVQRLSGSGAAVIGLSCSGRHSLAALLALIPALRKAAPDARLMVSGIAVRDHHAEVSAAGADALVSDMAGALAEMERLSEAIAPR